MMTLSDVFDGLCDGPDKHGIYTTLAPLYRSMYVARGRIEGQLTAVKSATPTGASTVLEIGCGTGDLLQELKTSFDCVIGADPSPMMARLAAEQCQHVCQADSRAFRPNSVDVAVLLGAVIGHIRPDATAKETISHISQVLRPGGRIVCSVHQQLGQPRSRELTRSVNGYKITQRDEQRPMGDGTFEWAVTFDLTEEATGETRQVSTATRIRAFEQGELDKWIREAGLVSVESRPREYVTGSGETDRVLILTAKAPIN
jgi:Methylase involved in ubiquinone/menaquinone biosynthesis